MRQLAIGILATCISVVSGAGRAAAASPEDQSLMALVSDPGLAAAFQGGAFFVVDDGVHGAEPWITDGTPGGTFLLRDVRPGPAGSNVRAATPAGDRLYFTADDGLTGQELWRTDGTPEGTVLVADIHPGAESSAPLALAAAGGLR